MMKVDSPFGRSHWWLRTLCATLLSATPICAQVDSHPLAQRSSCDPDWLPTFAPAPGTDDDVRAMVVFDDGQGPALYVAGSFVKVDGVPMNFIARWDGTSWTPLGSGVNSTVHALEVFDDGGGEALYVGGRFNMAGGIPANGIAKWDGTNWTALGAGVVSIVDSLEVFDDGTGPSLYVGGGFSSAGGTQASNIAEWDGSTWTAVGTGTNGQVGSLKVFDDGFGDALYAGGEFTTAGGELASNIAKWNGTNWTSLGSGVNNDVNAMAVFDDGGGPLLYAGGDFSSAGGSSAKRIAKWDGVNWMPLEGGLTASLGTSGVEDLRVFDDGSGSALYAGGTFTEADGSPASHIARWDGSSWSGVGSGITGISATTRGVMALEVFDAGQGAELFAGGDLVAAGGVSASNIARWNGVQWSPLGGGIAGNGGNALVAAGLPIVHAMTVLDVGGGPELFAAGHFSAAGGQLAANVAKWDGSNWAALGSGTNSSTHALAGFDDGNGFALYAGGQFTRAGTVPVGSIAKFDGSNWQPLGAGVDKTVWSLAVFDGGAGEELYVGGNFLNAGGSPALRIAKWDGTNWTGVGGGMRGNGVVLAMLVFDDGSGEALFAAGAFPTAGGVPANNIAKWDGTTWSALGSGTAGPVYSLAVFDDGTGEALYAGGGISAAGGVPANGVAKWDGTAWSALGTGLSGGFPFTGAFTLASFDAGGGAELYVGGDFLSAGGSATNFVAKWNGSDWTSLGSGVAGVQNATEVNALTEFDDGRGKQLFVGGRFESAGSIDSQALAVWGCPSTTRSTLTADVSSLSLASGGQQVLSLDSGPNQAGWFYIMFGSVTGTSPGLDIGGTLLPLNYDAFFALTLNKPGLAAFGNYRNVLDGFGQAVATFTVPPGTDPSYAGVTVHHAYLSASVFGIAEFASNAVSATLVP